MLSQVHVLNGTADINGIMPFLKEPTEERDIIKNNMFHKHSVITVQQHAQVNSLGIKKTWKRK